MSSDEWVSGKIDLSVYGESVEMEMTVPANPVKPTRMLPIFQMMTSSFLDLGASLSEEEGKPISCKAGCGACCRQAVPLAEVEAYQIAELVENMPEPRRSEVKRRFAEGISHFHKIGWFEQMDNYTNLSIQERQTIVLKYFYEGIACPFLENELCSIHPDRPLSCREYMVTSPAENCFEPTAQTIEMLNPLFKFSETLRAVGASENMERLSFVPLIRALEWADMYPEKMPEKAGPAWVRDFFQRLTNKEIPREVAESETL